ncbi:hypothetical protein EYR38_010050 [Pleurotus pulmonarius]|nr:hypothetical protein EYR38_010050 [Pleurotus pulmonarius]
MSRLFLAPRLLPDAGYRDDPGPVPFISKLILPGISPKVARDITIAGRRFELWSPNSRRLPFYPGIKAPGVDLEDLAQGKKRYDGHLGPLDPTYHPQHYQPRRPYLPFVRRHSHLNPPSLYPEFVSLFDSPEAWSAHRSSEPGKGCIPEAYIGRLKRRNTTLIQEAGNLRDHLRDSHKKKDRALWKHRPLYPSNFNLEALRDITSFEEALDTLTAIQRGIKLRDAWVSYVRLKRQDPWNPEDRPYIFTVEGNEQYMGVWMSDEVFDDALLYLTRSGVACFFLHEYTPEESAFHHRTLTPYPDAVMQNYSLISAEDGPWRKAVAESRLRPLAMSEAESVGRVRKLPTYSPKAGSLSLSNRQGYRHPSLRDEGSTPAPVKLAELEPRALTPVMLWPNADGLETDLPPALSLAEAKARHAALTKPTGKTSVAETSLAAPSCSTEAKGKQRQSPSNSLPDYESDGVTEPSAANREGAAQSKSRAAPISPIAVRTDEESNPIPSSSSRKIAAPLLSERAQELYAAYAFEISEFWRVDCLPRGCSSALELLALLKETAKKIPFAVRQILRTWRQQNAVYWIRFEDKEQALKVRGCLSSARFSNADGCDGPLVAESVYLLALEEVRHPEERPLSPTGHWNLPIEVDARFVKASANATAPSQSQSSNSSTPTPLPAPSPSHASSSKGRTIKSITPDTYTASTRSPPSSPTHIQTRKRLRINSPPRQFIASRSTRAVRETSHSYNRAHKSLSERIDLEPSSHQRDHATQLRPKGSDSRYLHNRQRYYRKQQHPPA